MQIKVVGQANLTQMQAQFAAVTAEVEALNKAIARTSMMPAGGSPAGFAATARAANSANAAYNSVLASSGAYRVEQLKINDSVSKYTDLLQKQKLSFREVFGAKNRNLMRSMYREQLAMQRASIRGGSALVSDGSQRMSIAVPTGVEKSWDTLGNRVGFFRAQLASASQQLVNWGKNTQWAGRQLMAGITMPIAAFGAAAGVMAYQSDKAMAQITKVYDFSAEVNEDSATREKEASPLGVNSLKLATDAAKEYGSSISSTLDIEQQLAATGLKGGK